MPQAQTYQSEFTGLEMDARFTAVAQLTDALEALTAVVAQKYVKPASGIPSTDLDADVNAALAKANSAIQSLADYYTKAEVDQLLAAINGMDYVDVASLPTASASTMGKIYLVGPDGSGYYAYYYTSYDGSAYSWVGPLGTTEISLAGYASKAELNQLDQEVLGETLYSESHTYNGAGNWSSMGNVLEAGQKIWLKLTTTVPIEITFNTSSGYVTVETIRDNDWHYITVPSNKSANTGIYLTYRGSDTVTISALIVKDTQFAKNEARFSDIKKVENTIIESTEKLGEGFGANNFNSNVVYCPNKRASENGYLNRIEFTAGDACTLTVYIGELDQLYRFIPRAKYVFQVASGENILEVRSQNIKVYAGEYVAFLPSTGGVKFNNATAGSPLSENSFLYSLNSSNLLQLQVYGAQKIFKVNFYAEIVTSSLIKGELTDKQIESNFGVISDTVSKVASQIGIVKDASGNAYRLIVADGEVTARPLNFSHAIVVGNSFTVHPTVSDTGTGLTTSLWWGHWAMAASSPNTAWTKLLQDSLKVKDNDASVTPIFGRQYETGGAQLTDNDAFIYWDNGTKKYLAQNLSDFDDVDCVIIFLGDNYSGDDWATKYTALYNQLATWFPSAQFVCVGSVTKATVDEDIQEVASAKGASFVNVFGIKVQALRSREGNFVLGDDEELHQINNSSVGGHFGDFGQLSLVSRVSAAIGYVPVASAHSVTLASALLSLTQYDYLEDSVVSVFADASVNSISVVDASNNAVTATQHTTDYGNIFTFTMPASDVTVSVVS